MCQECQKCSFSEETTVYVKIVEKEVRLIMIGVWTKLPKEKRYACSVGRTSQKMVRFFDVGSVYSYIIYIRTKQEKDGKNAQMSDQAKLTNSEQKQQLQQQQQQQHPKGVVIPV